jgi:hypothetical protein
MRISGTPVLQIRYPSGRSFASVGHLSLLTQGVGLRAPRPVSTAIAGSTCWTPEP